VEGHRLQRCCALWRLAINSQGGFAGPPGRWVRPALSPWVGASAWAGPSYRRLESGRIRGAIGWSLNGECRRGEVSVRLPCQGAVCSTHFHFLVPEQERVAVLTEPAAHPPLAPS